MAVTVVKRGKEKYPNLCAVEGNKLMLPFIMYRNRYKRYAEMNRDKFVSSSIYKLVVLVA